MRVLIRDYIIGNLRFESAIQFAIESVPRGFEQILDLGCGIGYSSWLLKKAFPKAHVCGFDISDESIEFARKLFRAPDLEYHANDFIASPPKGAFDLVTMFDFYEHIPFYQRTEFYSTLNNVLNNEAWLVITTPTVEHQDFLRKEYPDRIQIVDENVTLENLLELAEQIHMTAVKFERKEVWHFYDYQYFVASRIKGFKNFNPKKPPVMIRQFRYFYKFYSRKIKSYRIKKVLGFNPLNCKLDELKKKK